MERMEAMGLNDLPEMMVVPITTHTTITTL
jgi:hypothetical protein